MAQKSFTKRIKIKTKGKALRRATTLGHSRSNKSGSQMLRKRKHRSLTMKNKVIAKYI